ncbi:ovomucoid-like [Sphaerodactylus townsendi]|uniref:ovomucoid-like n=1 Tax=Sphaerodactylus townsendi TaxID=933632 RepID=UPI0020269333|nr:ovomucoid-like [Sphaerodactylus townsendi]
MKTAGFLFLHILILFFYFDAAMARIPIDCSGFPSKICTADYNPHCGVIRKTYGNKCHFCNAFVQSGRKLELEYYGECRKHAKNKE